jgi:hypothetical protein
MATNRPFSALAMQADDFQRAAAEAEALAGTSAWWQLSPKERARAIYAQLRRIDAEHAASPVAHGSDGRRRGADKSVRRMASVY